MKAFLFFFLASPAAFSASLFSQEAPIELVLSGNIADNFEYREVEQRHYESVQVSIDGQVFYGLMKVRGNTRAEQCDIPPFKLKVSDKNPYFKKSKAYKIVTHCNDQEQVETRNSVGNEVPIAGDNYLLQEYLSYKIQSLMMPNQYQARLLKISYVDDNNRFPKITRYAFVLERSKRLAKRLEAKYLNDLKVVDPEKLLLEALVWSSYFNLLIGNQDYTLWAQASHNFNYFETPDGIITVAHDFNLSEVMNRETDSKETYYNMYAHNVQFPCSTSEEAIFRRIGKELFLKKEEIFQYLDDVTQLDSEIRQGIRSLFEIKFAQLQSVVMNDKAVFKKEEVSWSPGFCSISFGPPESDI